jgi:large subunit ribosomal protein L10
MRVAKNTLTKIAAHSQEITGLDDILEGPTALVFAGEDPAQPAKILRDFARLSRILEIKGAVMEGQILSAEQVADIADLPSRDELIAKVVGGIASPLYGIVIVLSGPVRSLAYVLQARKEQLEQAA